MMNLRSWPTCVSSRSLLTGSSLSISRVRSRRSGVGPVGPARHGGSQAGLIDDRPVTTHWSYTDDLTRNFPRADVRPDRLYIDDGDVLTSAGLAAGLDLCIHLVRRELGAAAARDLARWNVIAPHRDGGQAQFTAPVGAEAGDPLCADLTQDSERLHDVQGVGRDG